VSAADARTIHEAAIAAASPSSLVSRLPARVGADALAPRPLDEYGRVLVVGAGKAALATAGAMEPALRRAGARLAGGAVVVPHGYAAHRPAGVRAPDAVAVREAAHPLPDAHGVAAAREAHALAASLGDDDLLLVLLSGGASALWAAPAPGLALDEVRAAVRALQHAGAPIAAVNTVRRRLSLLGGGGLAAAARADVAALVLSDVIGDDPAVVGSGPATPDPTTAADAARVLRAYGAWEGASPAVRAALSRADGPSTRDAPDRAARTRVHLLGGVGDALAGARAAAARLGYAAEVRGAALRGEAREVGRLVARALVAAAHARPGRATCLLWGGETTVTVRGAGRGGRNQELALAAALALDDAACRGALPEGARFTVLSAGTDGIDGPTDAAGGCVDAHTVAAMRARGVDPVGALAENDSYAALDAAGALLRTGPTHTNVMDVQVALVRWVGAPVLSRSTEKQGG
jgi:hydroxypyruvate reductase